METILLVEDNEYIMDINSRYLASQGYAVEKAFSVREAERVLLRMVPDLIVLDVMLPDGDGMDLCARIRRTRNTPILFLTARVTGSDVVAGLERGGDDYLTKPYDLDVFGSRVKALLRRAGKALPEGQVFFVGPLRLDIIRGRAFVGERDLNLSGKEFGVLLYLAQRRGAPVSREEMYRAVWGQYDGDDRSAIWPMVSRLKKKLAPYEALLYIESDHSGYELVIADAGGSAE